MDGTLILAAKGQDGIILAADSRLNVQAGINDSSFQVGYIDNFQKIFTAGNYALAIAGKAYAKNESVNKILSVFLNTSPKYSHPASFLQVFTEYIYEKHPDFYENTTNPITIVCCGYYNGVPYISIYRNDSISFIKDYVVTSITNGSFKRQYSSSLNCEQIKKIAINTIDSFPLLNADLKYHIGGNTSVLKIQPQENFKWLTSQMKMVYWDTFETFANDFVSGKFDIKFLDEIYREPLIELYKTIISDQSFP